MAKVVPFHSIKQKVYHNNSLCTEGNKIERENRKAGTGENPKCKHCKKL